MADSVSCDEIVVALLEEPKGKKVVETENDFLLWVGKKVHYSTPAQLESALRALISGGAVLCRQRVSAKGRLLTFRLARD